MKNRIFRNYIIYTGCIVGVLSAASARSRAQTFEHIGHPDGVYVPLTNLVSGDGSTIVGRVGGEGDHLYRWTREAGFQFLDTPEFAAAVPGAISRDGTVFVGTNENQPFRWSQDSGFESLPVFSDTDGHSIVSGVSGDGLTIVGALGRGVVEQYRGAKWTVSDSGITLEELTVDAPAVWTVRPTAISDDGSVIAGYMRPAQYTPLHACLWSDGDMTTSSVGERDFWPMGLSPDGRIVVGTRLVLGVLWTNSVGFVPLGVQNPHAVNSVGSRVVCATNAESWSSALGDFHIAQYLGSEGFAEPGYFVEHVNAMTLDGRALFGRGFSFLDEDQFGLFRINLPCLPAVRGDMNCDCNLNADDIGAFAQVLVDRDAFRMAHPECHPLLGDFNRDGSVNGDDIAPFIAALLGQ